MAKLWAGLTNGEINKTAEAFNSSIKVDSRMAIEDIKGSIAHADMLSHTGIISKEEGETIKNALFSIMENIENGSLKIDMSAEDIHTFIEQTLTDMIGDTGKKLHTARSRNDQVALDLRLTLKKECESEIELIKNLLKVIVKKAEIYKTTVLPGYTHLQRAQPITFAHQLLAYAMMFLRDKERLLDAYKRIDVSPIGACALAGTTYNTDRFFEAEKLGFSAVAQNSIDAVSDRDFAVELMSANALIMVHLSRFSEEIILWATKEFDFIQLSNDYSTGSSIMPQKKNPDMAELVRGKTGRVYGDLFSLLTTLKGLPLAYNKDLQEDKESVFDSVDTVKMCLEIFAGMIDSMTAKEENMKAAAQKGFINATDLADYLVIKGIPFRDAYKLSAKAVKHAAAEGYDLCTLPLSKYKEISPLIEEDVYEAISIDTAVKKRISFGGTSVESVEKQIEFVTKNISRL